MACAITIGGCGGPQTVFDPDKAQRDG
jgi:hypothetical protein